MVVFGENRLHVVCFCHIKRIRICEFIIQYIVARYNSFDKLF